MERWFERTDLNMLLGIDGVTERRLLEALDSLEAHNWDRLQADIFQSVKDRYELNVSGVLYDVTNTYLYGKNCPLAKPGHDKRGVKGSPLVQVGLGVTKADGIPLFHKVFDGNVHDARTLGDLVSQFGFYGIKSGMLIYDRGIVSSRNLLDVSRLGWDTLCGLPIKGNLKAAIKPLMDEAALIRLSNRVRLNKTIFYVTSMPYSVDSTEGTLALCFNERQRRILRESRYDEIVNAQALLKQNKTIKDRLAKYFDDNGNVKRKTLKAAEQFDGYSCIFSTRRIARKEMVRLYFDKDLVEKAFQSIKGITRLQPVRHWLYNRVVAHVAICYLAYLLLSLLKFRLKGTDISPEAAFRELDTMYKVYMRDKEKGFKISRVVTLSKKQEQILKAIDPQLAKT
jgi:transposase